MDVLVKVAARIRAAMTREAVAYGLIAELAGIPEVRGTALVLCDPAGLPVTWIGDALVDREAARAYLAGGHRHDAAFARGCATHVATYDEAAALWVAPLFGADGVIGALRIAVDPAIGPCWHRAAAIAAHVSIRLAVLGLDDDRSTDLLTSRQREVAELVAHGCTNAEIAAMLQISANAVKKHVSRVLALLEVTNRTELAALTGRWRNPSGTDHILPASTWVIVRKPSKSHPPSRALQVA